MNLHVLYFGRLTEFTAASGQDLEFESGLRVDGLRRELEQTYPELAGQTYRIAVNQQFVDGDVTLRTGDEVALLPPFAGG